MLPPPRLARFLIVAALAALWELMPRAGLISPLFLPPMSATLAAGVGNLGEYVQHLGVTLTEAATAVLFACGGGILAGTIVGSVGALRRLLAPLFSSLYAVPLIVLYPLFTAWFGIGPESKIAFAATYGFFPTALGTAAGIQTIDPQLVLAARSMGATLAQRIFRVVIPAAVPTILSGLRLGGALTIVGVVVSEMLVSSAGIGFLISKYRSTLDSPRVFAAILLVLGIAVGFDALMQVLERRATRWRTAGRRADRAGSGAAPEDAAVVRGI